MEETTTQEGCGHNGRGKIAIMDQFSLIQADTQLSLQLWFMQKRGWVGGKEFNKMVPSFESYVHNLYSKPCLKCLLSY